MKVKGLGCYYIVPDDIVMRVNSAYSGQTCHPFRFKPATSVFLSVPR